MYIDRPLNEFLNDLSAKRSTPGGGSVAALTASTGAGLLSMVANFTIGNPKYSQFESKVKAALDQILVYYKELRELIDADVLAYNKLCDGIKSVANNDLQSDKLYKDACLPPFLVCEISGKCMMICRELALYGNKKLITDTAIAAILFDAAFFSAKFNVYINLKNVKDTEYIGKIHNIIEPLEGQIPKLKEEILEICEDAIIDK